MNWRRKSSLKFLSLLLLNSSHFNWFIWKMNFQEQQTFRKWAVFSIDMTTGPSSYEKLSHAQASLVSDFTEASVHPLFNYKP